MDDELRIRVAFAACVFACSSAAGLGHVATLVWGPTGYDTEALWRETFALTSPVLVIAWLFVLLAVIAPFLKRTK